MFQGFALNGERFLKAKKSDQEYFKILLERIKLICTSERKFYQKITDIFVECSIDYDKNSDPTITFYKTIQNKFHFAISGTLDSVKLFGEHKKRRPSNVIINLKTINKGWSSMNIISQFNQLI